MVGHYRPLSTTSTGASSCARPARWRPASVSLPRRPASCRAHSAQSGAFPGLPGSKYDTDEKQSTLEQATGQNNFYEIGVASNRRPRKIEGFTTSPWQITIGGLVGNPGVLDLEDVIRTYRDKLEERIYRMRCVEAWSMVIPWVGFPLRELIKDYEPASQAKYLRFETFYDRQEMPRALRSIQYPYVEGLRMDEAMHDPHNGHGGDVRRYPANSQRPADPHHRSVEVWLQGHQVNQQD